MGPPTGSLCSAAAWSRALERFGRCANADFVQTVKMQRDKPIQKKLRMVAPRRKSGGW